MAAIGSEFTLRLLTDAGLSAGMRVVDVGCGTGDVALIARDLVGDTGEVVGIDREEAPLEAARARARDAGLANVSFSRGDMTEVSEALGTFDAIVGRRVLMYQPDSVRAVAKVADVLRPGGLVVFHEHDTTMVPAALETMPLHRRVQSWMQETIAREGADVHMGFHLHNVLTQAGLMVEHVRAEAIVQTPGQPYAVAGIIRAILPRIVAHGVASEDEIGIDTLEQRLDAERLGTNATYVGDMMFGAWARKPG